MAIARLVSVKVLRGTMPPLTRSVAVVRIFAVVAVIRMVMIVDMAVEVFRAAKPRAGSDEDATGKPLGTVITVSGATVRRDIIITIRTSGRYTDADADLGLCSGSARCNAETDDGSQSEYFHSTHNFTSLELENIAAEKLRCKSSRFARAVPERLPDRR
jgi:hypothetical protein